MSFILIDANSRPAGGHQLVRDAIGENTDMWARFWDTHDPENAPHRWVPLKAKRKPAEAGLNRLKNTPNSDEQVNQQMPDQG